MLICLYLNDIVNKNCIIGEGFFVGMIDVFLYDDM